MHPQPEQIQFLNKLNFWLEKFQFPENQYVDHDEEFQFWINSTFSLEKSQFSQNPYIVPQLFKYLGLQQHSHINKTHIYKSLVY